MEKTLARTSHHVVRNAGYGRRDFQLFENSGRKNGRRWGAAWLGVSQIRENQKNGFFEGRDPPLGAISGTKLAASSAPPEPLTPVPRMIPTCSPNFGSAQPAAEPL